MQLTVNQALHLDVNELAQVRDIYELYLTLHPGADSDTGGDESGISAEDFMQFART